VFAFVRHYRHKLNKLDAVQKWEMTKVHDGLRDSDVVTRANPLSGRRERNSNAQVKSTDKSDLDSFFTMDTAFNQSNPTKVRTENKNLNITSIFASNDGERIKPSTRASVLANTIAKITSDNSSRDLISRDSTSRDSSSRLSGRISSRAIPAGIKKLETSTNRPNPLFNSNRVTNSNDGRGDMTLDILTRRTAQRRSTPDLESTLMRSSAQLRTTPDLESTSARSLPQRRSTLGPGERARVSHPTFSINLNTDGDDDDDDNNL